MKIDNITMMVTGKEGRSLTRRGGGEEREIFFKRPCFASTRRLLR